MSTFENFSALFFRHLRKPARRRQQVMSLELLEQRLALSTVSGRNVDNTTVELPPRQRVLGYDSGRIWPWLGVCDAISTRSMRFQLLLQLAKRYY